MADVPGGVATGLGAGYRRHCPEDTLLYQIVAQHYPAFAAMMSAPGRPLPTFVQREFEDYLKCGRLDYGFLRVRCSVCHAEKLVAFSCKRRGFCPSCGARRMVDSAALLVDEVLPHAPIRQWVLSVPFPLRFLFAREPQAMRAARHRDPRHRGSPHRACRLHYPPSPSRTTARGGRISMRCWRERWPSARSWLRSRPSPNGGIECE